MKLKFNALRRILGMWELLDSPPSWITGKLIRAKLKKSPKKRVFYFNGRSWLYKIILANPIKYYKKLRWF